MANLSPRIKIQKVADHTTAATTTVTSATVDMLGYEGCLFITSYGTAASGNIANVQQSADDSSYADLLGSAVTSGSSDEDVWIDVYRPGDRYLQLECVRATSSTLESIWAIKYGGKNLPEDNTTSGTITGELHASPAEGTA